LNPVTASTEMAARMTVKARDGLRLRTGPGTAFDVQHLLQAGTPVSVAGRTGDWAAIDLKGDGLIDGFAHAAFLGSGH